MAPLPGFPVVSQLSGWWRVAAFAVVAGLYIARLHASIQSTRRRASDGYVDLESSMAQQTGKLDHGKPVYFIDYHDQAIYEEAVATLRCSGSSLPVILRLTVVNECTELFIPELYDDSEGCRRRRYGGFDPWRGKMLLC
ncbi:hypothetical protein C8J57DRAFT_1546615 [Mycena rebaudengoi]|nr:hypothetical protein C8J57DRAFT_1546615 [Mycena rebaudengoi]